MLYVVVATLDNLAHTKELLRTLGQAAATVPMRVICVDNGSSDGTVEFLSSWGATALTVLSNEVNIGVSASWNMGIRFAIQNRADAVLVCGNDTAPVAGTVEKLWQHLQDGMLFVTGTQCSYDWTGDSTTADLPLLAAPDYSFFMFQPSIVIERMGQYDLAVEFYARTQWQLTNKLAATPYPMRMNPWDYGLFDTGYALGYFEDNDHHLRAHNAGIACLRDQSALFRHDCSLAIRTHPELAEINKRTFPANAERFRAKWNGLPHEVGIIGARPLNVSDAEWAQMSGGRDVQEVDGAQAIEDAKRVYAQHGVG